MRHSLSTFVLGWLPPCWRACPAGRGDWFGVSAASAVRWAEAVNMTGSVEAKPQGGDTRSHPIEAFGAVILAAVAAQKA